MKECKRYLGVILLIALLLISGCGFSSFEEQIITKPYEISIEGVRITYTGNEYKTLKKYVHEINKNNKYGSIYREAQERGDSVCICTNEDGKIRVIHIYDKNIKSYKGISVGDSISKVKNTYKYVNDQFSGFYSVYFDENGEEIDYTTGKLSNDNNIVINYKYEDDVIVAIIICDWRFAKMLY